MNDICLDNRFKLIEKYKKKLIEGTNIETSPDEMHALDSILFRFWQMGWLDRLEITAPQPDNSGDLISRQAAIDAIMKKPAWHGSDGSYYHSSDIRQAFEFLPPAQPELIEQAAYIRGFEQGRTQGMIDAQSKRKKGKWNHGLCSVCGYDWGKDAPIVNVPTFCPNCGADMRGTDI